MIGILKRAQLEQIPVEIIYMSKKGILTQRSIQIIELNGNIIKANCLLRKSKRTFQIENILSAAFPKKKGYYTYSNV